MVAVAGERKWVAPREARGLFSILVFAVFLSGCSGLLGEEVEPMLPAAAAFTFEQYEVVTGSAKRQTVLTGFLLGGAIADLAVVNIDENDDRRLQIYGFDGGTWVVETRCKRCVPKCCSSMWPTLADATG